MTDKASPSDFLIRGSDYLAGSPDFKLVGRDEELKRLTGILMRDKANSVLMVGPGGVGCTAICMGLQASKSDPDAPFDVVSKRFFWMDADGLFGSGDPGKINEGFQKMLKTLSRSPDTVLVIEDTKDFVEAANKTGCSHLINALMREIRGKKFQAIFETRDEDLEVVLKCHSEMREMFTTLDIQEPLTETLLKIATESAKSLEKHHGIKISPEAISTAIDLTNKYRTSDLSLSRAQPERSLTLLDRSLTTYRLNAHSVAPELPRLEKQLAAVAAAIDGRNVVPELKNRSKEELEAFYVATESDIAEVKADWETRQKQIRNLYKEQRGGEESIRELEDQLVELQEKARETREKVGREEAEDQPAKGNFFASSMAGAGFESAEIRETKQMISQFQKEVAMNAEKYRILTQEINSKLLLSTDHVLNEFSTISGIPASKLSQDERAKLLGLEATLGERVFGQAPAVRKLSDAVQVAKSGLQDPTKPQASFLFLGPSGVGKTELAKALTAALQDDEKALLRFDMSEYMEKHAVAKLIGAPPGYEGYEAGGILTNAMRRNPSRVILFDEIEKAHPDVFNVFLQILDDARLTDNRGLTVSFRDAIIIMTTNIGTPHFLNKELSGPEAKTLAMEELAQQYRPEFLNRFNGRENIVCFDRLELPVIEKVAKRELGKLNGMIAVKSPNLKALMPDSDLGRMCADTYEPINGARGITGLIAATIKPQIAKTILGTPEAEGVMNIRYDADAKTVHVDPPVPQIANENTLRQQHRIVAGNIKPA